MTFECNIGKQIYFKIFLFILILAFKFNELREERGTITEKWKSEEVTFLLLETSAFCGSQACFMSGTVLVTLAHLMVLL